MAPGAARMTEIAPCWAHPMKKGAMVVIAPSKMDSASVAPKDDDPPTDPPHQRRLRRRAEAPRNAAPTTPRATVVGSGMLAETAILKFASVPELNWRKAQSPLPEPVFCQKSLAEPPTLVFGRPAVLTAPPTSRPLSDVVLAPERLTVTVNAFGSLISPN